MPNTDEFGAGMMFARLVSQARRLRTPLEAVSQTTDIHMRSGSSLTGGATGGDQKYVVQRAISPSKRAVALGELVYDEPYRSAN